MLKRILFFFLFNAFCIMALAQTEDRGLGNPQSIYVSKGQLSGTIGGSYNTWNASADDDLTKGFNILGILTDANGDVSLLNLNANASWFFKDNCSVGVQVGYGNMLMDINSMSALGLTDLSNKHLRRETYSAFLTIRRYLPLFDSKILALFGEASVGGSMGYNKSYKETDRGKEGTFSSLYATSFKVMGGVSVFVTNRMAFEVRLPSFSIGVEWDEQIEKQEYESKLTSFSVIDGVNVLGIQLALVCYF